MLKAFTLGPPKTGTSTLHYAFVKLGWLSVHSGWAALHLWQRYNNNGTTNPADQLCLHAITDAHLTKTPKYNNMVLWPTFVPGFLERMRDYNPDTLFILNKRRDVRDWVDSVTAWKDLRQRITDANLPGLPEGVGDRDQDLINWVEGYYARVRRVFKGCDNFIEFNIEDDDTPERLEKALGVNLLWWGVRNARVKNERQD